MRKALEQLEDDRRVALAGISHDIRTPLTRLRMEVELASISQDVRANLVDDIERIDGVVRQFIDYARASVLQGSDTDDAAPGVKAAVERWRDDGLRIKLECPEQLPWVGRRVDVDRLLDNLLSNIARYARSAGDCDGELRLSSQTGVLAIEKAQEFLAAFRVCGFERDLGYVGQGGNLPGHRLFRRWAKALVHDEPGTQQAGDQQARDQQKGSTQ
ncbi:MAG: hypothetical protein EBX17_09200 [Betaproteobacteria bacterium]|nr:hypothetical protein [Betaproteobacteria bacterium]